MMIRESWFDEGDVGMRKAQRAEVRHRPMALYQ